MKPQITIELNSSPMLDGVQRKMTERALDQNKIIKQM